MAVNPVGFVPLKDNVNPDGFTGRAIAVISGGYFVSIGSQAATVSSGPDSFAGPGDIWIQVQSGTDLPAGVAMHNAASGANVSVIRKAELSMPCDGNVAPGERLQASAAGQFAVSSIGSADNPIVVMNRKVGYALTGASSGGYVDVRLDL